MAPVSRRMFLGGVAAAAALTRFPAAGARLNGVALGQDPFTLGVASGDPLPDRVVIWTRLAPDPLDVGAMPAADVPVAWEVASDSGFSSVVRSGTFTAAPEFAHSVHVDVTGLDPDHWYYYRFSAGGFDSPVGRTRTAPPPDCTPDGLAFGFASCQSYPSGYYTAHEYLAQEQLDLVFFLGDYIYEGGNSGVRPHNSPEVYTLDQYRNRYGLYKSDANLRASHAAFPWIVVWDDHEVDNNYAGSIDQDGTDPATFLVRRAAAYRAWWEHQPVRMAAPGGSDLAIHRSFAWGDLAAFFAIDTRQFRDDQACGDGLLLPTCAEREDPNRQLLGVAQESWLTQGLEQSPAVWNVIANQMVMTAMPLLDNYNMDQWDGYPAPRERLFETLARPEVRNPVVITGDIHASGIADLVAGPDQPAVGTELVGTSISSGFTAGFAELAEQVIGDLPWVQYVNARQRGYVRVDVTTERLVADYRLVDTVTEPTSPITTATSFTVESGVTGVTECTTSGPDPDPPPPPDPEGATGVAGSDSAPGSVPASPAPGSVPASATRQAPSFTG